MGFTLFVMCHDDASLLKTTHLCETWKSIKTRTIPVLLPPSPYMESSIYSILAQEKNREIWENEDYVGIVTYSILDKLVGFRKQKVDIDWETVVRQAHEKDVDVIGLFCLEFKRSVNGEKEGQVENIGLTLLESGVFHHGLNFYRSWRDLLLSMGYSQNTIDEWAETSGFFCNWWISKPKILNQYIEFINMAMAKVETNEELKDVFYKNSHYGRGNTTTEQKIKLFGKPFYTIHPFVFERLLSFFLSMEQKKGQNQTQNQTQNQDQQNSNKITIGSINNMVMRI